MYLKYFFLFIRIHQIPSVWPEKCWKISDTKTDIYLPVEFLEITPVFPIELFR